MQNNYDSGMGWASATTTKGQTVYSLLSNPGTRTPAINASTLAAYSRSAKSIPELLEYRKDKSIDGNAVLDRVISEYNHDSVRGLGHLSVAMEGVDCITAMQFFYRHHIQDGQERSTRFQNFSKGRKYAPYPIEYNDTHHASKYYEILDYWLDGVEHFQPLVKNYLKERFKLDGIEAALNPRTLDCVRYLVPMGVSTSVGVIQSGREWSKWISHLHGDKHTELAQAFESVLKDGWEGYTPEGDVLIRHTEAYNNPVRDMMAEVYDNSKESWQINRPVDITKTFHVVRPGNKDYFHGADPMLIHLYLLKHPYVENCELDEQNLAPLLTQYSWKNEVGPLGSSGLIAIHGVADLGTLKDLNRHRSSPSFIPILHAEGNIDSEIACSHYSIHPYLVGTSIGNDMSNYIEEGYKKVQAWASHNSDSDSILRGRAIKNLLPHAHVTPYVFYGSAATFMTYIANLRVRPGGHMSYRQLVHTWATQIVERWPLWSKLVPPTPQSTRDEFLDRS